MGQVAMASNDSRRLRFCYLATFSVTPHMREGVLARKNPRREREEAIDWSAGASAALHAYGTYAHWTDLNACGCGSICAAPMAWWKMEYRVGEFCMGLWPSLASRGS